MGFLSSAATVFFFCTCGTVLTCYILHVQSSRLNNPGYRALCDVDEVITCSDIVAKDEDFVELLEWVCRQMGVAYNEKLSPRQPALRIAFFPLLCLLGCLPLAVSHFFATFISSLASIVSAYLLYMQFQIHNQICLPCTTEYFIHILLFLVLAIRWANSGRSTTTSTKTTPKVTSGSGGGGGKDKTSKKTPDKTTTPKESAGKPEDKKNSGKQMGTMSGGKKEQAVGEPPGSASKKSTRKRKKT